MNFTKQLFFLMGIMALNTMVNCVHASAFASVTIDWSSFRITADGVDVTNSINWTNQADFAESELIEGALTGSPVSTNNDIDPNPGWTTPLNTTDGLVTSRATTVLSNNSVTASTLTNFTGRADNTVIRHGEFLANAATYTFSVDYSVSGFVNQTNSETGGGMNSLNVFSFVDLTVINESTLNDPGRDNSFFFDFDDSLDIIGFGSDQNTGTLTAFQDFNDNDFVFLDGDVITIDLTAQTSSRSFSSMPAPVPIPPAIVLFVSSLGMLLSYKLRQ